MTAPEDRAAAEPDYIVFGRCRSGKRWFWYVSARAFGHDRPHCDDPACSPGLTGHAYGWEDTEQAALGAMRAAATQLAGEPWGGGIGRPTWAAEVLKQINAAKRRARPPKPGASEAAPVDYLYEPWSWTDYDNPPYETSKGIKTIPVVKKTPRRIYYDRTDSRDRSDGVVTLGYIDRQDFEADTRCRDTCPRDIPAGLVCAPHGRDFPHCVHFGERDWDPRHFGPRGCGETCPVGTPGMKCAGHGYTWDHCPHGDRTGDCWQGLPAGAAALPGDRWHHRGGTVYATREAAEEELCAREREQECKREEAGPELRRLRVAMADAHPDRGGTSEGFIAARQRYEQALSEAS